MANVLVITLTAYLPFSVLLYLFSDSGVFETAVCSFGILDVFILESLHKMILRFITPYGLGTSILLFAMANAITLIFTVLIALSIL